MLSYFDELLAEATQALLKVKDEEFEKEWSMTYGKEVLFTLPKKQVARLFCMNHLVHHRAQLGVYLRILIIPLPSVYGPSADDEHVILTKDFRFLTENVPSEQKHSDKYAGKLPADIGNQLQEHITQSRNK